MGKFAVILLPILARFAWNNLVPLLYKIFEAKYGKGLMGFVFELIAEKHPLIESEKMTKETAENLNIKAIKEVTAQSPGLKTTPAKWIHTVCYMEKIRRENKKKFNGWTEQYKFWKDSPKIKYQTTDFMYLYKKDFSVKKDDK